MTEPNNDDVAGALERFAGGESETEPSQPVESDDSPPPEAIEDQDPVEADEEVIVDLSGESEATPSSPPRAAPYVPPLYQTTKFRQTIIPILLTCGVLTIAFGLLKFVAGANTIFSDLPLWLPLSLLIAGAVLLFFAVLNMLAVKHSG